MLTDKFRIYLKYKLKNSEFANCSINNGRTDEMSKTLKYTKDFYTYGVSMLHKT